MNLPFNQPSWIERLLTKLTMLQKYCFVNLFFLIPLLILGWNSWQNINIEQIKQENEYQQLANNAEKKTKLFYAFIIALVFYLIGSILSFLILKYFSQSLKNIAEMARHLPKNESHSFFPTNLKDEVGEAYVEMNQLASSLHPIKKIFQQLSPALIGLTNGDFSIRLEEDLLKDDFSQTAQSFNQLSENFEAIMQRLFDLGKKLAASTDQLGITSKQQSIVLQKQQQTTLEISSASNEISDTAKSLTDTVNEVTSVASHTSSLASTGQTSLIHMEEIMQTIVEASNQITSKLNILSQKASNINHVVTTITKVADQTNLLSLNASIEAERAGEFGRGFMIIAQEIRRLADQTAVATLNIERMIQDITSAVSNSVSGIDEFSHQIQSGVNEINQVKNQLIQIISEVKELTDFFGTVNSMTQSQSTSAEQINESIQELSKTTQYTSESIHHFTDTIYELKDVTNHLIDSLSQVTSINK